MAQLRAIHARGGGGACLNVHLIASMPEGVRPITCLPDLPVTQHPGVRGVFIGSGKLLLRAILCSCEIPSVEGTKTKLLLLMLWPLWAMHWFQRPPPPP